MRGKTDAMRIPLSDSAASAVEVDVMDPAHGEDEYPTIRAAWRNGALVVTPENAAEMWSEVCDLANAHDERSTSREVSAEERAFAGRASRSLTTAMSRISAYRRQQEQGR